MAAIKTWSTTAASNNSTPPDGFPENMARSAVNDGMREVMAQIKAWYDDAEWRDLNHTVAHASATSFTVTGVDVTAIYTPGRRVRLTDSSTLYGTVVSSTFSTNTTVNVLLDSGSVSVSLSAVALGLDASSVPLRGSTVPAMSAYITTTLSNVTGNNTQYTIVGWTEEYDYGGAFDASTGVYTAKLSGVHTLGGLLVLQGMGVGVEGQVWLQTSGGALYYLGGAIEAADTTEAFYVPISGDVLLTAGTTFTLRIQLSGIGSDTVDIMGLLSGTNRRSWFSCRLVA